jgi:hypothetical protein
VIAVFISGLLFSVPDMVTKQGIDWWVDDCQRNVFYGLITWYIFSIVSLYFAPKRFLIVSSFGVLAPIFYLPGALLMAEAGDIESLAPQFWMMKCVGITFGVLSLGMLVVVLWQKLKDRRLRQP